MRNPQRNRATNNVAVLAGNGKVGMAWTDGGSLSADAKVNGSQATHRVLDASDWTESEVRTWPPGLGI